MKRRRRVVFLFLSMTFASLALWAQNGIDGINEANDMVRSYFPKAVNLMYAIGAVVGLIGAVKVYSAWVEGEPHTKKLAAGWFGACIFLVVVATVIKSFFGI